MEKVAVSFSGMEVAKKTLKGAIAIARLLIALLLAPVIAIVAFGLLFSIPESCHAVPSEESAWIHVIAAAECVEWSLIGVVISALYLPATCVFMWFMLLPWALYLNRRRLLNLLNLATFSLLAVLILSAIGAAFGSSDLSYFERLVNPSSHQYLIIVAVGTLMLWIIGIRKNSLFKGQRNHAPWILLPGKNSDEDVPDNKHIRALQKADLDSLLSLYTHLHSADLALPARSVVESVWNEIFSNPNCRYFGVFVGEQLVSSCTLTVIPNLTRGCMPYGLIENVVTHSDYRNKGYGKAILARALESAWASNCYKVMLLAGRKDEATLQFYNSAGFDGHDKSAFIAKRASAPAQMN